MFLSDFVVGALVVVSEVCVGIVVVMVEVFTWRLKPEVLENVASLRVWVTSLVFGTTLKLLNTREVSTTIDPFLKPLTLVRLNPFPYFWE